MAGMAEQAFAGGLLVGSIWLALIGIATAVAFWKQSMMSAVVATYFALLFTVLFTPWSAFAPLSKESLEDPDMQYWTGSYQILGVVWVIVVVAVLTSLVTVQIRRSRRAIPTANAG
jgi:hypothetical protein